MLRKRSELASTALIYHLSDKRLCCLLLGSSVLTKHMPKTLGPLDKIIKLIGSGHCLST